MHAGTLSAQDLKYGTCHFMVYYILTSLRVVILLYFGKCRDTLKAQKCPNKEPWLLFCSAHTIFVNAKVCASSEQPSSIDTPF